MKEEDLVKQFNLISLAGSAKSSAYEAIEVAQKGDYQRAKELLKDADDILGKTHDIQVEDIQNLVDGKEVDPVNLIDVHAQDHVMSAIEVRNLAEIIINMYQGLRSEFKNE
ncbi:PTS lactose/cellobiose transporter subunit IIA [Lapidilactobacillus achengensis]|uniref:PTS lactose/cellobiose transporter subunit IIA n=1 Tax=Lapidilactobacillus achengensis TaxID=2486000 RepID=A0ABW1UQ52_9LACO|nr:PTS lactose/cellobiose transporter subunit IIA [Lapidilactobacillus achengensis]